MATDVTITPPSVISVSPVSANTYSVSITQPAAISVTATGGGMGTVNGTGTANTIAKFTGVTTVGNSVMIEDSSRIGIGTSTFLDSGNILRVAGTSTGTIQLDVNNLSSGTSASSDIIATADTGTNTTNYVDVGINSSAYSDSSFTIGGALAGYLYSNGGDLTVGTQTAAKVLKLHTGGTLTANLRETIADTSTQTLNLIMQPFVQSSSQIVPTGYSAMALKQYAITSTNKLTIQGTGYFAVR